MCNEDWNIDGAQKDALLRKANIKQTKKHGLITKPYLMNKLSFKQVGHRLKSTMGMIRKTCTVIRISGKFVEHEKRVEILELGPANWSPDSSPATFTLPNTEKNFLNSFSEKHMTSNYKDFF